MHCFNILAKVNILEKGSCFACARQLSCLLPNTECQTWGNCSSTIDGNALTISAPLLQFLDIISQD